MLDSQTFNHSDIGDSHNLDRCLAYDTAYPRAERFDFLTTTSGIYTTQNIWDAASRCFPQFAQEEPATAAKKAAMKVGGAAVAIVIAALLLVALALARALRLAR